MLALRDGTQSRAHLVGKIAKWKRNFVQEIMDLLGVRLWFPSSSSPHPKD